MRGKVTDTDSSFNDDGIECFIGDDGVEYVIGTMPPGHCIAFSAGANDLNNPAYRDRRKLKRAMNRFTKAIRRMRLKGSKAKVILAKKREVLMDAKSFIFSGDSDRLEGSGVEFNIPKPRGGWFDPRRGKLV